MKATAILPFTPSSYLHAEYLVLKTDVYFLSVSVYLTTVRPARDLTPRLYRSRKVVSLVPIVLPAPISLA